MMTMYCTHSFVPSNHNILISALYVSWCCCFPGQHRCLTHRRVPLLSQYTIYPSIAMGCTQSRHAPPFPDPPHHPNSRRKPYDHHRLHHHRHNDGRARAYRHQTRRNPRYDPIRERKAEMRQAYDQNRDPIFRKHRRGWHDDWYF